MRITRSLGFRRSCVLPALAIRTDADILGTRRGSPGADRGHRRPGARKMGRVTKVMEGRPMAIVVRENFLTPQEIADLLHCANTLTTWDTTPEGYWNSRIAHADRLRDRDVKNCLVEIRKR